MPATIIIVVILVVICVFSVMSYMKKLKNGCCGGGGDEEGKVKVTDKNISHYPHSVTIAVDGMSCAHCKQRVENALNSIEGVWAEVDLKKNSALVRMKQEIPEIDLRRAVIKAGYGVTEIKKM